MLEIPYSPGPLLYPPDYTPLLDPEVRKIFEPASGQIVTCFSHELLLAQLTATLRSLDASLKALNKHMEQGDQNDHKGHNC